LQTYPEAWFTNILGTSQCNQIENQDKSSHKLCFGWLTPVILATLEADCGSRPSLTNSSQNPISKITRAKWTRSVAQVVEHLFCKCEALSSNASLIKKKINHHKSTPCQLDTQTYLLKPQYSISGLKRFKSILYCKIHSVHLQEFSWPKYFLRLQANCHLWSPEK
jgi:hypothetical protein